MWLFCFYKKRNILFSSLFVFICFLIYQLHFFATISSVASKGNRIVQVLDHSSVMEIIHVRSEHDKFINENGLLRGVLLANMARYRPDSENNFKCLTSGEIIPFDNVNDDYCDCTDGTDEPSTTACINGTFYCDTQYQVKPVSLNVVPSNRINDGICDCCDGSDEWYRDPERQLLTQGSLTLKRYYASSCPNLCHEM